MNNIQLTEMDSLRASAGLHSDFKKPQTSKLKTLDIESELLRSFSNILRDFSRMKSEMGGEGYRSHPMMMSNRRPLKMELGEASKNRLYVVAMKKIELLKEAVEDCFGKEIDNDN